MRESRKFCQRGTNFDKLCFVFVCFFFGGGGAGGGEETIQANTTISGPSSACRRNAI